MAIKKSFYTTGKNKTREFILYQLTHSRLRNSRLVTRALQFCLVIILNIPTDWKEVQRYFGYFRSKKLSCSWLDIIRSCFSYGSTIEEYFVFYFCKREPRERASYITESIRHCVSKQLNMPFIDLMRDKFQFHQQFERFMQREAVLLNSSSDFAVLDAYCKRQGRFVIKPRYGAEGYGVEIVDYDPQPGLTSAYIKELSKRGDFVLEEVIS